MSQRTPQILSGQLEDRWLHLKNIQIDSTFRTSKFKIVFKHASGFVQKFDAPRKSVLVNWECNIYVDLGTTSVLTIHRTGMCQRLRSVVETTLYFNCNEFGDNETIERKQNELVVKLVFGMSITLSEVAQIRAGEAIKALESKKEIIDKLDLFVHHFDFVVQVGTSFAQLHPAAQVAASIVSLIFENIKAIPNAHQGFTDIIHDMDSILPNIRMALERSNEAQMQSHLSEFVHLVRETSQDLIEYYSPSKKRLPWNSSKKDKVLKLKYNVQRLKDNIVLVVTLGLEVHIAEMKEVLATLRLGLLSDADKKSLDGLKPPRSSSYDPDHCCLSGTRTSLLQMIKRWAPRNDQTSRLYWLYGVAGSGKSSVAASVAHALEKRQLLSGSFFCKRDISERRDPIRLIQSLAHFLARANKNFATILLRVLREDPTILDKPLRSQFEMLLENPLSEISTIAFDAPVILIIDALDECDSSDSISSFLARMVELAPWLKLIVTSRPNQEIRKGFSKATAFMTEHDLFAENAHDDILSYIRFEFSQQGSLSILQSVVSDAKADGLANKADGLFIWAATVLKYAGNPSIVGKVGVIDDILSSESASSPEAELDALYQRVLSSVSGPSLARKELIRLTLGLLFVSSRNRQLPAVAFHAFLPRELRLRVLPAEVEDVLHKSGAVLTKDAQTGAIRVLHPSFLDFIGNENRSKDFWMETAHLEAVMSTACLEIMNEGLKFNICRFESSYHSNSDVKDPDLKERVAIHITQELQYSSLYWLDHLSRSEFVSTSQKSMRQMLYNFLCTSHSLYWLESMSLVGELSAANLILQQLPVHLKAFLNDAEVRDAASDLRRFVSLFHMPMTFSTPHIYLSALLWAPSEFIISKKQRCKLIRSEALLDGRVKYCPPNLQTLRLDSIVLCVAFSRNGSRIISGSLNKTIQTWDAQTGAPVGEPLRSHSERVNSLVFSPDGSRFVTGSGDKTIRIWDAQSSAAIGEPLRGHGEGVNTVVYSPDGNRIISGSDDRTLRIWDAQTGASVGEPLQGHSDRVLSVAYSPNGSHLVSGSADKTIRIWDAHSGTQIGETLLGHSEWVRTVGYSADGNRIISGSDDETIQIWDAQTGALIGKPLQGHNGGVNTVAISPDGRRFVSGSGDSTIRIWDAQSGTSIDEPLLGHSDWVRSVAYSPDGSRIVSGSADATIRIWDAQIDASVGEPSQGHSERVWSIACSSDGSRIISGSNDKTIRIWDAQTGALVGGPLLGHSDRVLCVVYTPDGSRIISGSDDKAIRIWDAHSGAPISEPLLGHSDRIWSIACSSDGNHFVSGSDDSTLRIWDAQSGAPVGEPLRGHSEGVNTVAYSPDGNRIISGSDDKTIRIWDAQTGASVGKPLLGHSERVWPVAYSPDGNHIVSGSDDKTIWIWDAQNGAPVGEPLKGHNGVVNSVAYSPNGSYIVSGSDDKTIRIWDAQSGTPIGEPLQGHSELVLSVTFTSDGNRIVSASDDKTIRIWDIQTSAPVGIPLQSHKETVNSIATLPSRNRIVSGSEDEATRIWNARISVPVGEFPQGQSRWDPNGQCFVTIPKTDATARALDIQSVVCSDIPLSIPPDGWIRTLNGGLLLWVPDEYRNGVCDMSLICMPYNAVGHRVRIDWKNLCHGKGWTKVWDEEGAR